MSRPPRAREDVAEALLKADDQGRRLPAPLSGFRWVQKLLEWGVPYRQVPADHWEAKPGAQGDRAEVRCLCGEIRLAHLAAFPVACECGRWFFYDGTCVWSLASPAKAAAA